MRLRTRSNRAGLTEKSRPSTGMSPPMVPVDGDYPLDPTRRATIEESIGAMERHFALTSEPAVALSTVTVGQFVVFDAREGHRETT